MRDRLPRISIKTDLAPEQFLRRMETAAANLGEYLIDLGSDGESTRLIIRPLQVTQHRELEGRLATNLQAPDRVAAEVAAARWNPEPPTYETYVAAARVLFLPILRQYNHSHGSKRKLHIPSKADMTPHLPPMARGLIETFTGQAHKSGLTAADWRRFYRFIRHCSAHNLQITRDDLHWLLVNDGFAVEHAAEIADVYEHGRGLLSEKLPEKEESQIVK